MEATFLTTMLGEQVRWVEIRAEVIYNVLWNKITVDRTGCVLWTSAVLMLFSRLHSHQTPASRLPRDDLSSVTLHVR